MAQLDQADAWCLQHMDRLLVVYVPGYCPTSQRERLLLMIARRKHSAYLDMQNSFGLPSLTPSVR